MDTNKFTKLAPSPELCQKIPDDAFQDSALVHAIPYGVGGDGKLTPALGYAVFPRDMVVCDESLTGKSYKEFYGDHDIVYCYSMRPAPTLEEILEALADLLNCEPVSATMWRTGQTTINARVNECDREDVDTHPTNAALRLWLNLKQDLHK